MWRSILLAAAAVGCLECFPLDIRKNLGVQYIHPIPGSSENTALYGIYSRIFGGATPSSKKFPYIVAVELTEARRHICGASIIADHWALTAASCVFRKKPEDIQLRSGVVTKESGGELHEVVQIKSHDNFDYLSKDFDVAVLRVDTPFNSMAKLLLGKSRPKIGASAAVTGWGITTGTGFGSDRVESVDLRVFDDRRCNFLPDSEHIADRTICVGYPAEKPLCIGDIGGPLIVDDFIQVGIVSKGNGCGRNVRAVYTDVAALRVWIEDMTDLQTDAESNWDWIWNWEWAWDGDMNISERWKCLWIWC